MTNRCMKCMRELKEGANFCPACGYNNKDCSNPERALPIGTILNQKYQIGAVIGEGGFGITYVAWDILIGVKIAIKEYFPSELVSRDTTLAEKGHSMDLALLYGSDTDGRYGKGLQRFVQEAETLARFQKHPGVVSVKDFFYENNTAYMVMEYIEGTTLKTYLEQNGGTVSLTETLTMLQPLMNTLEQMHQAGIIHRDISPENIMITPTGQLKLIDFGASRYVGLDGEKSLTVILKHGYAPEEQYRSDGIQGPWTDVYALCAVIYRMLTGQVPEEIAQRMLSGSDSIHHTLMQVPYLPKQTRKTLEKGLALKKEKRIQSVSALYHQLYQASGKSTFQKVLVCSISAMALLVLLEMFFFLTRASRKDDVPQEASGPAELTAPTAASGAPSTPQGDSVDSASTNDPDESVSPDVPEEPEHLRALREYYNANCAGVGGCVYFVDLTGDSYEEMIVTAEAWTPDPDTSEKAFTPTLTVYQYWNDEVETIYSYQREIHLETSSDKNYTDYYLFIQEGNTRILKYDTYREYSDAPSGPTEHKTIEEIVFTNTEPKTPAESQETLNELVNHSILLLGSHINNVTSWSLLTEMADYQDILTYKQDLEGILEILQNADEPVLNHTTVYDGDMACIFAVTGPIERSYEDIKKGPIIISVWSFYNAQTQMLDNITLDANSPEATSWDGCDLFQFGKMQHYFVEVSGAGYWVQHKFCFENGAARKVEGNIYFIKDQYGEIQAQTFQNTNFYQDGNDTIFSCYDHVNIFYYDHQYVEYGVKLVDNNALEQYENYTETIRDIEDEISRIDYINDDIYSAINFSVSDYRLDHIQKSDNDLYYLNYTIKGFSPDDWSQGEQVYDGWIHAVVKAAGNRLELRENPHGSKIIQGPKQEHSDLGLPVYLDGNIIEY